MMPKTLPRFRNSPPAFVTRDSRLTDQETCSIRPHGGGAIGAGSDNQEPNNKAVRFTLAKWGLRMRPKHRMMVVLTLLLALGGYQSSIAQEKKLPNITILATGGTIAGAAATGTRAAYTSGAVTIDAMLTAVPGTK